jgi:hypothetical protein
MQQKKFFLGWGKKFYGMCKWVEQKNCYNVRVGQKNGQCGWGKIIKTIVIIFQILTNTSYFGNTELKIV